MNGYYGISTWLTYMNLIFGVIGIGFAFTENFPAAVSCLVLAGVCDTFDGTVAKRFSRTHSQKSYGIQIDSLADLVSFGVLPGAIGISLGLGQFPSVLVVAFYVLAALIRLAWFNVTELEFLEGEQSRSFYEGLPVTTVAVIIPLIYLLSLWLSWPLLPVYGILLGVIAVAFVSKFRIRKPKLRHMIWLGCISVPAIVLLISAVK